MSHLADHTLDDSKAEIQLDERPAQPLDEAAQEEIDAHLSAQEEREKTIVQALRSSKWQLVWLCYGAWMILACSYDNNAAGLVFGIPGFRRDFGYYYEGDYVLPANWQAAFAGGPAATQIFGTFLSGTLGDKIGRKYMALISYLILMVGITLEVIANITPNPSAIFFVGKMVNGVAIGAMQITGFIYTSEIAPVRLRGIFTSATAIAYCIGTLVLALILQAFGDLPNSWSYKSIFVSQYAVTGLGLILLPLVPETPQWLVMKGRYEDAFKAQKRLGSPEDVARRKVANIKFTLKKAAEDTHGATYAELFRRTNLRRTIVATMPLSFQAWSGVFWIVGYFVYYAQLAGFSTAMSYKLNVTQQVLSTTGNMCSWFMIERFGRRALTLWGMSGITLLLLLGGITATIGGIPGNTATISFILIYCWWYNCTIGATSWVAASEIGTNRLSNKTAGLGLAIQGALATFWNFVLPYMFNPNAGNLQGKVAFIYGATAFFTCVYTFFYHPETKGRSFEEIDEMFMKRLPARKFATYVTDAEVRAAEVKALAEGTTPDLSANTIDRSV